MLAVFQILVGLVALIIGGELLVRGASAIAAAMRISPLVIGLTVVAFGTSAPELGVSLQAAYANSVDVAVGNVIGSNVFNVLCVLGLAALFSPLVVSSQLIRLDVPLMIGASVLTWLLARDGMLSRPDGALLFLLLLAYLGLCFFNARRGREPAEAGPVATETGPVATETGPAATESRLPAADAEADEAVFPALDEPLATPPPPARLPLQFVWIALGLIGLGYGSKWLVTGSVSIATWLGVSELIIGLTIVAVGTSLPEIVTSVVATIRGQRDIAVGNVVGSNLFNLGCVLGISGMVAPGGIPVDPEAIAFDMPVMIAVAAVCLPIFFTGQLIARWEGILLLSYYVAYTGLLIFTQTHPSFAEQLGWVLGYIVIPLTVLTIAVSVVLAIRTPREPQVDASR